MCFHHTPREQNGLLWSRLRNQDETHARIWPIRGTISSKLAPGITLTAGVWKQPLPHEKDVKKLNVKALPQFEDLVFE